MKKRLFFSIDIPRNLKNTLSEFLHEKKTEKLINEHTGRKVPEENFHITILFVGYLDEKLIPRLVSGITDKIGGIKPFEIRIEGLIPAPPGNMPKRMIWLSFESNLHFEALCGMVKKSVKDIALEKNIPIRLDKRPPSPHITLARFKKSISPEILPPFQIPLESVCCSEIQLMESHLRQSGPLYEVLTTFRF